MKFIAVVLLAVASAVLALPTELESVIPVLRREETRDEHGQYVLNFETGNGIHVEEEGTLKEGPEGHVLVKKGSYSYTAPDGQVYKVSYTADEDGYKPILSN